MAQNDPRRTYRPRHAAASVPDPADETTVVNRNAATASRASVNPGSTASMPGMREAQERVEQQSAAAAYNAADRAYPQGQPYGATQASQPQARPQGQPYGQAPYGRPAYPQQGTGSYGAPAYPQQGAPGYGAPAYPQQGYAQQPYLQPGYQQAPYQQAAYQQPQPAPSAAQPQQPYGYEAPRQVEPVGMGRHVAARAVLALFSWVFRIAAIFIAGVVVLDSLSLGAGRTELLRVTALISSLIPQGLSGMYVMDTPLGGAFRGDFAIVALVLLVVDWILCRIRASLR
ncbi:MAG: hypothetical protein ACI4B6_08890 [Atopobiaceae bacterium]